MGEGINILSKEGTRETGGNSNDPRSESTEKKRGRGRPPKTETGTEQARIPKLVMVDVPGEEPAPQPETKKKAGRPKGASKKTVTPAIDSTQVQMILMTISGIIASRPGMQVWNLSAEEVQQIANPLSNIMGRSQALTQATSQYADGIALVTAVFMIFIPKYFMWKSMQPQKPKKGELVDYGPKPVTKPRKQEGPSGGNNQPHGGQATERNEINGQNLGGQLSSLISPIAGF